MRQIIVRRFKSKAGQIVAAAVVSEAESCAPKMVVVLARRDLVWLQSFFAALNRGRIMDYRRMQKMVTSNLDALTNGSTTSPVSKDVKSPV